MPGPGPSVSGSHINGHNIQIGEAGDIFIVAPEIRSISRRTSKPYKPYAHTLRSGDDVHEPVVLTEHEAEYGTRRPITLYGEGEILGTATVRLPPGLTDEAKLRVRGKGVPGKDGHPPGDLYITVFIEPEPQPSARDARLAERSEAAYLWTMLCTADRRRHFLRTLEEVVNRAETQNLRDSSPILAHLHRLRHLPSDFPTRVDRFVKESSIDGLRFILSQPNR